MLYYFVKYACQLGFRINFRKVFFHYQEKIPKDKPVIFAVNHPTAFIDPVLIGAYIERETHFIVRGDIFKGKFILAILRGLKLLPIFRFRDGFSSLKSNQTTMETVYQKLAENNCLMVLAEGQTKHEKRLRPIQKGAARMAFGTVESQGELDMLIYPVGVNYTDSHEFRSYIMVECGKAIKLSDYMEANRENPRKAINDLTDRIEKEMRKLVIHIKDEADDDWINRMLEIHRNDFAYPLFPIKSSNPILRRQEYDLVEQFNNYEDDQKQTQKNELEAYDQLLEQHKVNDRGVARPEGADIFNFFLLVVGLLPFLYGYLFNYPPMRFVENFTKKKVKQIEFYSSVRYGVGLLAYMVYFLLLFIVALVVWHPVVIGLVIAIPVAGYFALIYRELYQKWNAARKFLELKKDVREHLKIKRAALLKK